MSTSAAHRRLTNARDMLKDLRAKYEADMQRYRLTGDRRRELRAWLLNDEISRAQKALNQAQTDMERSVAE